MESIREEANTELAGSTGAPRLKDERFRELVGRFLSLKEEASGAERVAEAYEDNARAAAGELSGKSEDLDEFWRRREEVAAVVDSAGGEAQRARDRAQEAAAGMGGVVRELREEGMPEGEWIRHGDLGVYLHRSSEERAAPVLSAHPWGWAERSPSGATPRDVQRVGELLEEVERRRLGVGLGLGAVGAGFGLIGAEIFAAWALQDLLPESAAWATAIVVVAGVCTLLAACLIVAGSWVGDKCETALRAAREDLNRAVRGGQAGSATQAPGAPGGGA